MNEIKDLLAIPLDHDNGHTLREQMAAIEPYQVFASMKYREAAESLADMRGKVYDPSGKTELERKVTMERNTRAQQREADEWQDVAKSISTRISMGQTFLRSMQSEVEAGIK